MEEECCGSEFAVAHSTSDKGGAGDCTEAVMDCLSFVGSAAAVVVVLLLTP